MSLNRRYIAAALAASPIPSQWSEAITSIASDGSLGSTTEWMLIASFLVALIGGLGITLWQEQQNERLRAQLRAQEQLRRLGLATLLGLIERNPPPSAEEIREEFIRWTATRPTDDSPQLRQLLQDARTRTGMFDLSGMSPEARRALEQLLDSIVRE